MDNDSNYERELRDLIRYNGELSGSLVIASRSSYVCSYGNVRWLISAGVLKHIQQYNRFPECFFMLTHLTDLQIGLDRNLYLEMPPKFSQFTALQELRLEGNFGNLDPIKQLTQLKILHLIHRLDSNHAPLSWYNTRDLEKTWPNLRDFIWRETWHWCSTTQRHEECHRECTHPTLFKKQWHLDSFPSTLRHLLIDANGSLHIEQKHGRRVPTLPKLFRLTLKLCTIPDTVLEQLILLAPNLIDIRLNDVGLTAIPQSFASLENLEHLHLSHNKIQIVPSWVFRHATLDTLTLRNNPIKTFHSWRFDRFASLHQHRRYLVLDLRPRILQDSFETLHQPIPCEQVPYMPNKISLSWDTRSRSIRTHVDSLIMLCLRQSLKYLLDVVRIGDRTSDEQRSFFREKLPTDLHPLFLDPTVERCAVCGVPLSCEYQQKNGVLTDLHRSHIITANVCSSKCYHSDFFIKCSNRDNQET